MKPWLLLSISLFVGMAFAELPPPTPAEKAELEKSAAEKAATVKEQEQALAQVQERIARQYRESHADRESRPAVTEPVQKTDVPKAAKQPPGAPAKPYAGRKPNPEEAQSHSQQ